MLFCTQFARFYRTDLFVTRLQRVVAELDHTHPTWCFFTRKTCRNSDYAHFSILRYTHKHTNCHLGVHILSSLSQYIRNVWKDLANLRVKQLNKYTKSQQELSTVCFAKCSEMSRADILWSVTKLARVVTKWTKSCDKRLARSISYIHHTSE